MNKIPHMCSRKEILTKGKKKKKHAQKDKKLYAIKHVSNIIGEGQNARMDQTDGYVVLYLVTGCQETTTRGFFLF